MAVLGGVIIGSAFLFYAFCLVHFGREMMRSRNKLTCYGMRSLTVRVRDAAIAIPARATAAEVAPFVPAVGRSESESALVGDPAGAQIISTYRKNRLAVFASGTQRLAVKRAAKGSS
jgi:hypothetical protein